MLTFGWSHYFDLTSYAIYHRRGRWSVKLSVLALIHIYQSAFLKSLEHKITTPVTWQSPIKFVIRCPTWMWSNCSATRWWWLNNCRWCAFLKYRWLMCVSNHLYFYWTMRWFQGQGSWKQALNIYRSFICMEVIYNTAFLIKYRY